MGGHPRGALGGHPYAPSEGALGRSCAPSEGALHTAEIRITAGAPWTWRIERSRPARPSKSRRTSVRYISKSGPPRDADFGDTPEVEWPSSPSPCASTFRPRTLLFAPEHLGMQPVQAVLADQGWLQTTSTGATGPPTGSPQAPEASCVGRVGHVSVDSCPTYRNTSPFWVQLPTFDPPFYVHSHGSLWFYIYMYVCM